MCAYCEPDRAGNLAWLRDEPDNSAWLEEYADGTWGLVISTTMRCNGFDCTTEVYVEVRNCPMCGRVLAKSPDAKP